MARFLKVIFAVGFVSLISVPAASQITWTIHDIALSFDGAWEATVADIDGDSDLDVAGAAVDGDDVAWFENDGSQNFTRYTIAGSFESAKYIEVIDIDGDVDMDIVASGEGVGDTGLISWWENDGDQNFSQHDIVIGFEYVDDIDAVDLDSDGDIDVLAAGTYTDSVCWWDNDGNENFTQRLVYTTNRFYPFAVAAHDMDSDGDLDVLIGADFANFAWYENNGNENFTRHNISDRDTCYSTSICIIDMDLDSDYDILTNDLWQADMLWYENTGNQTFVEHIVDPNYRGCWYVSAGDINEDGAMDVVGAAWRDSAVTWWERTSPTTFTRHDLINNFAYARTGLATDLDQDGDLDILGTSARKDKIVWWESDLATAPDSGFIVGHVEEGGLIPIPDVIVSAYDNSMVLMGVDTTDAAGEYAFEFMPGTYSNQFHKSGYRDTTLAGLVIVSGDTTPVNLIMYAVSACEYMLADINSDGSVLGGDVTYGVRFFKGVGAPPPDSCYLDSTGAYLYVAGDVNGNCEFRGSDITRLVAYFKGRMPLSYCHFFPPPPLR